MSLKDAAAQEAYLKTLLDVIDASYKRQRLEVQKLLDEAARESGTQQIAASLPDGTKIATISLTKGRAEAKVTDEAAFKAWVMANYDTEIERRFVAEVRGSFRSKLLSQMTAANKNEWADPETGVIHTVPGVAISPARARGHSVRMTETGPAEVWAAWRTGQLANIALPELIAGDADG
ncbi:hypothetical protein [Streptomyces sp. NBC_01264]|uniref:hypothetical protein n=1 Tax=Streptomyces sp. NBC_01264 TaxID=2903804 RepID=UPI002256D78D|nr:hypothetical protein [Streptomyces sp. NBC_01264]MCX4778117.1 hypothetical protein [Streptomyces sp. NBC_01264]